MKKEHKNKLLNCFIVKLLEKTKRFFKFGILSLGFDWKLEIRNWKLPLRRSGGYALMLSIVVSSVVLSIGLSLLNIVQKELILSATGRDSQFAFYASDAGIECALYWDIRKIAFPANMAESNNDPTPPFPSGSSVDDCGNTDFAATSESNWSGEINDNGTLYECKSGCGEGETPIYGGHEDDIATYTFDIDFSRRAGPTLDEPHGSCAQVTIIKDDLANDGVKITTTVSSRGHNDACNEDGNGLDNPALVERAIQVVY